MRIQLAFLIALVAMIVFTVPATAGPFFHIIDQNGNTISQLIANYPYPQASFTVDGCSLTLSGTVDIRNCANPLASVEVGSIGGHGCGNQLDYPFAEIDSDPAWSSCFLQAVNSADARCCAPIGSQIITYHMTAAPTAPGGMTFKRWVVHYLNLSGSDPFSGPTTPCKEGNNSLSCTITLPSDAIEAIPYPILIYGSFNFGGFLPPVDPSALNTVKAGSAVPIQFSLGGDFGLAILANNSPAFQPTSCNTSQPTSSITDTVTAGGSSLAYDPVSNTYTYVWKTNKAWAGTCGQFILGLTDGTSYTANFQLY